MFERVLVSGANGFIGRATCHRLLQDGFRVRAAVRDPRAPGCADLIEAGVDLTVVKSIDGETQWKEALNGVDRVVHLAARVHVLAESARDPMEEFRRVNTAGSERLALAAAEHGVRRLVFVSSIGVLGTSSGASAFRETDVPRPHDAYTISKWEAEQRLGEVSARTGLEIAILRPPLVYGPGNPGNFLRLLAVVARGVPLPLASLQNRRSLLYVENLAEAISTCATHAAASGETFLVSDGEDLEMAEILRRLAVALGRRTRLFPFPVPALAWVGAALGRSADLDRLIAPLRAEIGKIRGLLGWRPGCSVEQGFRRTAAWYQSRDPMLR